MRRLVIFLAVLLACCSYAADPYSVALERGVASGPQKDPTDLDQAMAGQVHQMAQQPADAALLSGRQIHSQVMVFCLTLIAAALFGFRKAAPAIGDFLNARVAADAPTFDARLPADLEAEEKVISAFSAALESKTAVATAEFITQETAERSLKQFLEVVPDHLHRIRALFAKLSSDPTEGMRQHTLAELCAEMRLLRVISDAPGLQPISQLAKGLEGLLKQISEKPSYATPSTLRTSAGAIVLLETLCESGLRADLASNPPPLFLAVDDDPISRMAVSCALKKVFTPPALAENGSAALALAEQTTYDVVFLDVEMPGMDGFEVCAKLHQTSANCHTPVVFVTSHKDFDSRQKSSAVGGHDLIGKPFLPFEITLKALTLLLRRRLEADREARSRKAAVAVAAQSPESNSVTSGAAFEDPQFASSASSAGFKNEASETVAAIRALLLDLPSASPPRQQELFGEIYILVHALLSEAERNEIRPVARLGAAIQNLLRKLLERPACLTSSTIESLASALNAFEQVCATNHSLEVFSPALKLLVVDDDPFARRAISNATQLTLARPEIAETGEEALKMAERQAYDAIFLDILMPGLDGFVTCSRIRQNSANATTPIIFITSSTDAVSREQARLVGGNGFLTKPVLPAEIAVVALTCALRKRLASSSSVQDQGTTALSLVRVLAGC
ncbi:MAG TPA: response regulator [Candidatus Dormibacteraeota bacterium]|nr:response regulator [Candidatus Dormibacteraeota bacterium]